MEQTEAHRRTGRCLYEHRLTFCGETGVRQGREDVVRVWDEVALLVHKTGASEALVCTVQARLTTHNDRALLSC